MASAGKGLPFIGKMNEFLGKVLHPTVQRIGNSRAAIEVIHKGYYLLNPIPATPYSVEAGSTDNLVKITAHNFRAGDMVRLLTTANSIKEFEIIIDEIIDNNNFKLAGYLSASLTTGDTFDCLRAISERFSADGSTIASLSTPPISYNRKAAGVTTQTTVLEDLDTPANSRAMPVVLHGVDSASITITSGDLNISSSHVNDSVAIGNGTNLVAVTAANAFKVDGSSVTQPVSNAALNIDTAASGSISGTGSAQIATTNYGSVAFTVDGTWTGTITVEVSQDNSTWYPTTYVALASGNSSNTFTANTAGQINVVGFAYCRLKGATVASGTAFVGFIASNKVSNVMLDNPLPAGSNNIGNINNITGTITLPTLAATSTLQTTGNSSLSSIDTKTPVLGQALAAGSTPVVLTAAQITTLTPLSTVTINALTNSSVVKAQLQDNAGTAITLGQQVAGSSVPVVLPAAQITTLTPPAAITGFALDATAAKLNIAPNTALGTNTGPMVQASVLASAASYTAGNISPLTMTTTGLLKVLSLGLAATYVQSVTIDGVTAQTFAAPSTVSKWVKIQADDNNSVSLRVCVGGTATATNGHLFAPGRSEDFQAVATISVIASSTATAQMISITWG